MNFLIDGYNLLHVMGLNEQFPGKKSWEKARARLLDWIAEHQESEAVWVVFDGAQGTRSTKNQHHRGVRVSYSNAGQTADDQIESILYLDRLPQQYTVVSNDTRIRDAAIRRKATAWTCQTFVDFWIAPHAKVPTPHPAPPLKNGDEKLTESADELEQWLQIFEQPISKRYR